MTNTRSAPIVVVRGRSRYNTTVTRMGPCCCASTHTPHRCTKQLWSIPTELWPALDRGPGADQTTFSPGDWSEAWAGSELMYTNWSRWTDVTSDWCPGVNNGSLEQERACRHLHSLWLWDYYGCEIARDNKRCWNIDHITVQSSPVDGTKGSPR